MSRNSAAAGLHICIESRCSGDGRWCGVWDSKQVYWRAEGWLVKGRLPALTSPPPPFIPPVLPAPMSPLGSLIDPDSNGCPPSPYSSPPLPTPHLLHPVLSSLLHPSILPVQCWPQWPRFGLALSFLGGTKRLSLAVKGTSGTWSATHPSLVDSCVSQRYRQITARLWKSQVEVLLHRIISWLDSNET